MISQEGIDRNFQFLVLEVRRQIETTSRLLRGPSEGMLRSVLSRDNYTDTLKSLIEKRCISYFRHSDTIDKRSANLVTAINVATTNLERIADFCVNVATKVHDLSDPEFIKQFDYQPYFDELLTALPLVGEAFREVDTGSALRICQVENVLDDLYQADYDRISNELQSGENVNDLLACLYISHYLERMGDAMLNIGEALLFAATGEKLKLHDYMRLRDTITARAPDRSVSDLGLDFAWETRSGCRIAKVEDKAVAGKELEAIFKKGHLSKLRKERENIARWEELMPGLPPKVLEFREGEKDAALLLEFLDGFTLRDLIFDGKKSRIENAMTSLEQALRTVWLNTKKDQSVNAGFVNQISARIDDVLRLHPDFATACCEVGSLSIASLEELLARAGEVERRLDAPFTVLAHGDLNTDNIIYNEDEDRIHLIDLYRSCETDYVQDLSVFLVSNFRVPVFEGQIRDVLNRVTLRGYEFVRSFATEMKDATFTKRLMLGLARSFITSTRFEFDADFAKAMYMRAVYLLEKIIAGADGPPGTTELSTDVLVY